MKVDVNRKPGDELTRIYNQAREGDCGVGKKMRICCIENSSGYKMKNDRIENRKLIGLQLKNPSG